MTAKELLPIFEQTLKLVVRDLKEEINNDN